MGKDVKRSRLYKNFYRGFVNFVLIFPAVFLDDVGDLADLADHPKELVLARVDTDRLPFVLVFFLQLSLHLKHFVYCKFSHF